MKTIMISVNGDQWYELNKAPVYEILTEERRTVIEEMVNCGVHGAFLEIRGAFPGYSYDVIKVAVL